MLEKILLSMLLACLSRVVAAEEPLPKKRDPGTGETLPGNYPLQSFRQHGTGGRGTVCRAEEFQTGVRL
jgi:hypothetical protein